MILNKRKIFLLFYVISVRFTTSSNFFDKFSETLFAEGSEDDPFEEIPQFYFDKLSNEEISELVSKVNRILPKDCDQLEKSAATMVLDLDEDQLQDLRYDLEETDFSPLGMTSEDALDILAEVSSKHSKGISSHSHSMQEIQHVSSQEESRLSNKIKTPSEVSEDSYGIVDDQDRSDENEIVEELQDEKIAHSHNLTDIWKSDSESDEDFLGHTLETSEVPNNSNTVLADENIGIDDFSPEESLAIQEESQSPDEVAAEIQDLGKPSKKGTQYAFSDMSSKTQSSAGTALGLALELKEEANKLHRELDLHAAITVYEDCNALFEECPMTNQAARSALRSTKLSLALCYLKVEEYNNAEAECTELLRMGCPKAVQQKAFFRRARARDSLGMPVLAYRDLKHASSLGPDDLVSKMIARLQETHGTGILQDVDELSDEEEYPLLPEKMTGIPSLFGSGEALPLGKALTGDTSVGRSDAFSSLLGLSGLVGSGSDSLPGSNDLLKSVLSGKRNSKGRSGMLSAFGTMLEKPETHSMICNFLKNSKPESLKALSSMAGINLSESSVSRLHKTLTGLEPKAIGRLVKAAKTANFIIQGLKKTIKIISQSRSYILIAITCLWIIAFAKAYQAASLVSGLAEV